MRAPNRTGIPRRAGLGEPYRLKTDVGEHTDAATEHPRPARTVEILPADAVEGA